MRLGGAQLCRMTTKPENPGKPEKSWNWKVAKNPWKTWVFLDETEKIVKLFLQSFFHDQGLLGTSRNFQKLRILVRLRELLGTAENSWNNLTIPESSGTSISWEFWVLLGNSECIWKVSWTNGKFTEFTEVLRTSGKLRELSNVLRTAAKFQITLRTSEKLPAVSRNSEYSNKVRESSKNFWEGPLQRSSQHSRELWDIRN